MGDGKQRKTAEAQKSLKRIIMPLLPKESKLELDREGVIRWQSLLGGGVAEVSGG